MIVRINKYWSDYELIDCGNTEKLERFGNVCLIRPDVSAKNTPFLSAKDWNDIASAKFIEKNKNSGNWTFFKNIPKIWNINFNNNPFNFSAELFFSTSKHIGIFPEQVFNWLYFKEIFSEIKVGNVLNLFGYTGLTSLAVSKFAEKVTHVDSIEKIINISKQNARISGITNIRFIAEDAQKFVMKEIKRGNKYSVVILDPPPIGIGAKGELWVFKDMVENLLKNIELLLKKKSFLIMNFYTNSFTKEKMRELLIAIFPFHKMDFFDKIWGEATEGNNTINHGYFVRFRYDK